MSNETGHLSGHRRNGVWWCALAEDDLPEAERIMRLAFATFLAAPDSETFWSDRDYVRGRWRADHVAAWAAEIDGALAGSNFATRWGSVGFFGPLTIRPEHWDRGVGQRLAEAATARFLTAIMSAPAPARVGGPAQAHWSRYSALTDEGRSEALGVCRGLTDALYGGLDLGGEIRAVHAQGLGETVLLRDSEADGGGLSGFAVCHHGPRSEAGAGACLVEFGAVRPARHAERAFASLLDACGALAAEAGVPRLLAGVNLARREAHRHLLARGFRTEVEGVAMHRPDEPGYSRPGVFVVDDWR